MTHRWTDDMDIELVWMRSNRVTIAAMSAQFGVSHPVIYRRLRTLNAMARCPECSTSTGDDCPESALPRVSPCGVLPDDEVAF